MSTRLLAALFAILVPGVALADDCAAVGTPPASATIPQPAIEAHIAMAMCQAEQSLDALRVTPDDAGIAAMTAAAKPSFDMLDDAIAKNDPFWSPIASKERVGLHIAMAVRIRNSIPPITATTVGQPLVDHDQAHAALEPKIKPWLDAR
jgi:hypothetical protein